MAKDKLPNTTAVVPIDRPPDATDDQEVDHAILKIVLFVLGRGSRGKSTLVRWLVEVLREAGMHVIIGDGDRTNPTLRAFFGDAVSPAAPDDASVMRWTYDLLEQTAREPKSTATLLDFGGGDRVTKRMSYDMPLDDFMVSDLGIVPIAVHLVGSDIDDLAYIRDCEKDGRFAPARTAIIFNESLIPEHIPFDECFGALSKADVVQAVERRGGKVMTMPPLRCAPAINEARTRFPDAIAGKGNPPLGPVNRRLTRVWDEQMRLALEPLIKWMLP